MSVLPDSTVLPAGFAAEMLAIYHRAVELVMEIENRKKQAETLFRQAESIRKHAIQNYQNVKSAIDDHAGYFSHLTTAENKLVGAWGRVRVSEFSEEKDLAEEKKSYYLNVRDAETALKTMKSLGHPSQYGGFWATLSTILKKFFIIGFSGGCASIAAGLIALFISFFLSLFSGALQNFQSLFVTTFVIAFIIVWFNYAKDGGVFSSDREKINALREGYAAYRVFSQVKSRLPQLCKQARQELEIERQKAIDQAKGLLRPMHIVGREAERPSEIYQQYLDQIELEGIQQKEQLQTELDRLQAGISGNAFAAGWNEPVWQLNSSPSLRTFRSPGVVRLGQLHYPIEVIAPLFLDLAKCGHIFIQTGDKTKNQSLELFKSLVARLVFTNPLLSAKFVFIGHQTSGIFSVYQKLPEKMRSNDYFSTPEEIQDQLKALELHKRKVQKKIGNLTLDAYNTSANSPEMYHFICLMGFPHRFSIEALAYIENLIESGPQAGIHIIAQVDKDAEDFSKLGKSLQQALHIGAWLAPRYTDWELSLGGESYNFLGERTPDDSLIEKLVGQINVFYPPDVVSRAFMQVFLCYASDDKPLVREVYEKLKAEKWIIPWLDQENIHPGQDWNLEIEKALRKSDAVIVFLSGQSVRKEGYLQKELKRIINLYDEKPEGMIFVIPFRLDECDVPHSLQKRNIQWMDYFPSERLEEQYYRLLQALEQRNQTRPDAQSPE